MKNSFKFLFVFFIINYDCFAEYRAFQYLLKSKNFTNTITSTRNPVAFRAYHGGPQEIEINLLKTWMCPGYTGQLKPICPSPEKILLDQISKKRGDK